MQKLYNNVTMRETFERNETCKWKYFWIIASAWDDIVGKRHVTSE